MDYSSALHEISYWACHECNNLTCHLFSSLTAAMVSVKQLVFPIVAFASLVLTTQGESKSSQFQ